MLLPPVSSSMVSACPVLALAPMLVEQVREGCSTNPPSPAFLEEEKGHRDRKYYKHQENDRNCLKKEKPQISSLLGLPGYREEGGKAGMVLLGSSRYLHRALKCTASTSRTKGLLWNQHLLPLAVSISIKLDKVGSGCLVLK